MSWIRLLALRGLACVAAPVALAVLTALPAAAATAATAATTAEATAAATPSITDPSHPDAATTPLPYRSVWPTRAAAADATPIDWRAAHEAVRRAGGWRAYAREVTR
jgi:hypothetical protein